MAGGFPDKSCRKFYHETNLYAAEINIAEKSAKVGFTNWRRFVSTFFILSKNLGGGRLYNMGSLSIFSVFEREGGKFQAPTHSVFNGDFFRRTER